MHELLTTDEMAEADRRAVSLGVPSLTLMENAGRAVADEAANMVPPGSRIAVLCGPGNNGGDGFVAARLLKERGFDVRVACLVPVAELKGDAAEMAKRWGDPVESLEPFSPQFATLVIDAIFGAGLTKDIEGVVAEVVKALNPRQQEIGVLAVDVPTGIDGNSGAERGFAVRADRTITFMCMKPGHVLFPGRTFCGKVVVADIGIPQHVLNDVSSGLHVNSELWASLYPWPEPDGHKYTRGHAVVVSGPPLQTGAARLGARGALRIGAGLVTLVGGTASCAVNAMHSTAIMVREVSTADDLAKFLEDERRNSVLIGPGSNVGAGTARDVLAVLASPAAVVLDADALTSFANGDDALLAAGGRMGFVVAHDDRQLSANSLFAAIITRTAPVVLTPHDGEFKRLFGDLKGSKLDRARAAAKLSGAIVVLKGPDTVIASPDGRAAINANAPPWLATAGSGDVLAGFITGLLAQKMPAFAAACAAVWLHGECANAHGSCLIAEDLPEILPSVLAKLKIHT